MNRIIGTAPWLLLLGLCLGFTLAFPSLVLYSILQPIAVSLWLVWCMAAAVDQSIYWALLVLICCVWLVRVLPPGRRKQAVSSTPDLQEPITRIARWQALLRNTRRTSAGEQDLRASLQKLLEGVLAREEQGSPVDLQQRLKQMQAPSAVCKVLSPAPSPRGRLSRESIDARLAGWYKGLRRAVGLSASPDEGALDELLGWMESMMEMKDDQ